MTHDNAPAFPLVDAALAARIRRYWDSRAEGFAQTRAFELQSDKRHLWREELKEPLKAACAVLSQQETLRALDIGTGPGFFSLILRELSETVSQPTDILGIDLSPEMIRQANRNAALCGADNCRFAVMDAQHLAGIDEDSIHLIVTRNLTWTLPDAPAAYREWHRVLAPGGMLVNFDADYGVVSFTDLTRNLRAAGSHNAHADLADEALRECDAIKNELSVSRLRRPQWDAAYLHSLGFCSIETDDALSERIYAKADRAWNPVPMFRLSAMKPR